MARRTVITLDEAWDRLLSSIAPLEAEQVPVDDSGGRYLREPVVARRTQPYADLSAMDGFAASGEGPWSLIGEARAGHAFDRALGSGQAVAISTGAALPEGADRIVVKEDASLAQSILQADPPPIPGRHIRRRGFDFDTGDTLLAAGTRMEAPHIALARTAGVGTVSVTRRPRVAILECGDELHADPMDCPPDGLPASNGAMTARMVSALGAEVSSRVLVPDRLEAVVDALNAASHAELLLTSGGASVGEHDLIKPALERAGFTLDFWRVAIRPGKPLIVARRGTQLMLGLPGNPVSTFVTAFLFALPALRRMAGADSPLPQPIRLPLAGRLAAGGARREFLRARLSPEGVVPIEERDSSALAALAQTDVLIDRPIGAPAEAEGSLVPCYLLENGAIA
ncbi:MAG: molybdopterin molybdotransferase MoeA [Erythrobacter sp.]|nr:molybdopterin molybdotransferase MoeA [Erythrobacter sp.]